MIQHLKESRHELIIGFGGRILTGIIVALLVVGAQVADRVIERREQQNETRDYVLEMERLVNSDPVLVFDSNYVGAGDETVPALGRRVAERVIRPFEEPIRLRRFIQALQSLELHLAARGSYISTEDSFTIQRLVLSYTDRARALEELRVRTREKDKRDTLTNMSGGAGLLSDRFFNALRTEVDWLAK